MGPVESGEAQNVITGVTGDAVAHVWAEVLQRENIGPNENFFDLGGDSLKALEVISRLQAALHIEIPLITFFEDPTIAHAAEIVEELRKSEPQTTAPVTDLVGPAPLSFQQLTFWLLQQRDP